MGGAKLESGGAVLVLSGGGFRELRSPSNFLIAAGVLLFFVPKGNVTWIFILGPIASVGVSVCYLIPWRLLPDVVDWDEVQTGQRREGIFYGFIVFLQKKVRLSDCIPTKLFYILQLTNSSE